MAWYQVATDAAPDREDSDDLARVLLKELAFPNRASQNQETVGNTAPVLVGSDSVE